MARGRYVPGRSGEDKWEKGGVDLWEEGLYLAGWRDERTTAAPGFSSFFPFPFMSLFVCPTAVMVDVCETEPSVAEP